ncbi:hypothetical protein NC652_007947 [Populus alba x Populus x berolinensis]|nr:hypothetical protein NC652_007947 [Populus alba x Populus x berolinensis]
MIAGDMTKKKQKGRALGISGMEDTLPSHFFFTSTSISHSHFVLCSPVHLLIESHSISTSEASIASNVKPTSCKYKSS